MAKLNKGIIAYNQTTHKKGKIIAVLPSGDYKVEVILSQDKETGVRKSVLEDWKEAVTVKYRKPNERNHVKIEHWSKSFGDGETNQLKIKVKYFDDEIDKLEKISKGDWLDLRASETVELNQFEFAIIPLGVGMELPEGYEAHVVPRSSTYKKWGIIQANSKGIIDNSYSGNDDQWGLPVVALRDTAINKNDRICQFRIVESMPKVEIETVESLDGVNRGGFGSTGTN